MARPQRLPRVETTEQVGLGIEPDRFVAIAPDLPARLSEGIGGGESKALGGEASLQQNIQDLGWFGPIASVVNRASDSNTWILFLAPLPAWVLSKALPGRKECTELLWLSVLLTFVAGANPLLKEMIQSARPSAEFGIEIDRVRDSYGFPSGHVTSGILLFGSIAGFTSKVSAQRLSISSLPGTRRWSPAFTRTLLPARLRRPAASDRLR